MKRIQYHQFGGPEQMRLEDFELPAPRLGQIVVRVKAASVNPLDRKVRAGAMKMMTGNRFPRAMGTDFAGVIEAIGPDVTRLMVGDEVMGTAPVRSGGSFAEHLLTEEKLAIVKPAGLTFEQAAALPAVSATAWCGLVDKARLRSGQTVFIHGCLGGVGRAAVQIAKALGAEVAGSCRAEAMTEASQFGCNPVVDYRMLDFNTLKNRFDVVYDTAGTLSINEGRTLLKRNGTVLDINITPARMLSRLLSPQHKLVFVNLSAHVLSKVAELAAVEKLQATIGRTIPLSQAIPAITELERQGTPKGKLVIVMP